MKRIRQILSISISLILLLVGIIIYQIITYKASTSDFQYQTSALAFCGNVETENSSEGKEIFNSNCAACHKLDSKSTGPALRGVDSLVFAKWIIGENHKIDTTKIEDLGIDYHRTTFKDVLNKENLAYLIDYCSGLRY
jgi:hypothetical protein